MYRIAGLMILCAFLLNWGCQANSVINATPSPSLEAPSVSPTQGQMTPSPSIPIEADMQTLIDKAMADLAQRLAVPMHEIVLLEATSVVWPDGSLGCPEAGMEYAQVLTPGYLIRLQLGDQEFEYHTSKGTSVIYCENPGPPVPGTPADT